MPKLVKSEQLGAQTQKLISTLKVLGIVEASLSFEIVNDDLFYLRFAGASKDVIGIKVEVMERTIRFDSYLMPYPEVNVGPLFEYMLRVQARLAPLRFEVGAEDAIYLVGTLATASFDDTDVSEVIASVLTYTDELFPKVMSIGFEGRFNPRK
jgi:hypothetical protein